MSSDHLPEPRLTQVYRLEATLGLEATLAGNSLTRVEGVAMNDQGVLNSIERLVQESTRSSPRTRSLERPRRTNASRPSRLSSTVCWDLLRQHRARREFHQDPDDASVRDEGTVERYLR
jgi:hypothetical protein